MNNTELLDKFGSEWWLVHFTDPESNKELTNRIHQIPGYLVATPNQKICVLVPRSDLIDLPPIEEKTKKHFDKLTELLNQQPNAKIMLENWDIRFSLDKFDLDDQLKECESCKGEGVLNHHCDCEFCKIQNEQCGSCEGRGKKKYPSSNALRILIAGESILVDPIFLHSLIKFPPMRNKSEVGIIHFEKSKYTQSVFFIKTDYWIAYIAGFLGDVQEDSFDQIIEVSLIGS